MNDDRERILVNYHDFTMSLNFWYSYFYYYGHQSFFKIVLVAFIRNCMINKLYTFNSKQNQSHRRLCQINDVDNHYSFNVVNYHDFLTSHSHLSLYYLNVCTRRWCPIIIHVHGCIYQTLQCKTIPHQQRQLHHSALCCLMTSRDDRRTSTSVSRL